MLPEGERGKARAKVLDATRRVIVVRSGDHCEFPKCRANGSDLCHGFLRGNVIGQPLCDHPALCWWGCRSHHDAYDDRRPVTDLERRQVLALEQTMVVLALTEFGLTRAYAREAGPVRDQVPVDVARWLERRLRQDGVIFKTRWAA